MSMHAPVSLSLYISTNSVEELAARTMIERIYKIDSFSRMLRFVQALTCLGTFTYPLKDDYHCGYTVAGQWHVEDGQHHATSLLQQGSWMTNTIIRNLKENKINTLNKYIKQ